MDTKEKTDWVPTRKWIAALVVALGTLLGAWAQAGEWSSTLTILAIGLFVERATAYLIPNEGSTEATHEPAR